MTIDLESQVKGVFSRLFNLPLSGLTPDSSPDTIVEWDSLQHLNLVVALEEELAVQFSEEEIVEMLSLGLVVELVRNKLSKT